MGKKYYYKEEGAEKGARFSSIEELKQAIWELFKDKMSKEEFENFIKDKIVEVEE